MNTKPLPEGVELFGGEFFGDILGGVLVLCSDLDLDLEIINKINLNAFVNQYFHLFDIIYLDGDLL